MTIELILVVLGIVFFVVALAVIILIRNRSSKKTRDLVVRPSFERQLSSRDKGLDLSLSGGEEENSKVLKKRGRLFIFAAIVAAFFGALFVRLWSLQLLNSQKYEQMALDQSLTEIPVAATRGRILDRNGVELVGNSPALSVSAPKSLADDINTVQRLSLVLGVPQRALRLKLLDQRASAQANRVLATGISISQAAYIQTRPQLFPSVEVDEGNYRSYPYGSLAAHLLGYISPVTQDDLNNDSSQGFYASGDEIGRTGAETAFEDSLRGTKGSQSYRTDAAGNPTQLIDQTAPVNGLDVKLTLDLKIQQAVDSILPQIIASARSIGRIYCDAGALVCLDVATGGILGASSYPTFFPEAFTQGISQDLWDSLTSPDSLYPLTNRVTSGQYPAASTFKSFISMAGLENGMILSDTTSDCKGYWIGYGENWRQWCWLHAGHGVLGLEEAINQSCDVYFYDTGDRFWQQWVKSDLKDVDRPNPLQEYLRTFGFGSETGLDIGGEAKGRVPDAAWKKQAFSETPEDAQWQGGDMTNLVIGQGDILVTPLQIANGYSGIARRKMLKPHLFLESVDAAGQTVESYAVRESDVQPIIEPAYVARVEEGLSRVVKRLGGDFLKLPVAVRGKTGTGEVIAAKETCSWFVCYAPADAPEYCVACVVEQAGTGDSVALQAVQHVLAAIYDVDIGPVRAGPGTAER